MDSKSGLKLQRFEKSNTLYLKEILNCFLIKTYYSFPYSTSVEIYESYLDDFPAVSICNLNPFDTTDPRTQVYFGQILNIKINPSSQSPAIYEVRRAFKLLMTNFMDDLRARNFRTDFKIVNNFDDLVLSCYFNGQKCDSRDFQRFFAFGYGQCFTFNKKINDTTGIKKTSKTGPESGLTLEIFTGSPEEQHLFFEKKGLYLAVHNNSADPVGNFEGIKLPVGTSAEIGIKRTFYRKLSEPFSKCVINASEFTENDPESYKQAVSSGSYTRKKCFEFCLQIKLIIPKCNCSDPQISTSNIKVGFCKTIKQTLCVEEVRKQFDSEDLSLTCDKECPVSCDTMEYSYHQSFSDYPTQYYYEIIKKQDNLKNKFENLTFDSFKQNTLMVNVFYQELSSTLIKETELIRLQDLAASIGGLLGLFLGCSVLTLMEPIAFIIDLIYRFATVKNQPKPFLA
ncbi:amiloride-sensitive sodium channel subunit gamma-like [Brachionus plicatilis]|uniref:Amiloride-sensitive sodium channel subunit gamma-like n=1 Tax=Brachionus plicatilis TaxID=10195 RepID=A0A3M7SQB4_BRAPC|nr:amiloride-sensitive sodium channel subunit gamma-like [Brachionus plicatilis]